MACEFVPRRSKKSLEGSICAPGDVPYVASLGKGHNSVGPAAVALRSAAAAVIRIKKVAVIFCQGSTTGTVQ